MMYGALAIYEQQPELALQIINRGITTIQLPMKDYMPDGAYPEGYGYWATAPASTYYSSARWKSFSGKTSGFPRSRASCKPPLTWRT